MIFRKGQSNDFDIRFKTGLVLSEQLPMGDQQEEYWKLYGGKPDIIGADLEEVCKAIVAQRS